MKTFRAIILWAAWTSAVGLWVADPFLSMRYYEVTQRLNFYAPNADSIGIPIFGAFFIGIIGFPFWFLFCRKAFRQLSGTFKLFNWEPPKTWKSIAITLAFGLCIYSNIRSARHYYDLFHVMQKSAFSHLSELAFYLITSSVGWSILWILLGICIIAGNSARKEDGAHIRPKTSLILILGWLVACVVAFMAGSDIWSRTIVRSKDELQALSKESEMVGIWQLDLAEFRSKDYRVESFREFKVTLHSDGSFAADEVPPGIFFNEKGDDATFKGTWKLNYYNDYYSMNFSVHNIHGPGGSIGSPLMLNNGHFVFGIGNNSDSINIVRTSSSTED